jgi:HAD superfamily hydrolase (TIGR01509 family)
MGPVRAAVFDIGATLVTGPPVAPNKVIAALMKGVTAADVASVIMTTEIESAGHACRLLEERFGPMDAQAAAEIFDLWHAQRTAPTPLDGAREAVVTLKSRGLNVGLLSDIWSPYYAGVERALPEVVGAADAIVLSCRTGVRKPSPDNFLRVLDDLGVVPEEAVMVGDTYTHDILPAIEVGMKTVWVLARPDRESEAIIRVLNGLSPAPVVTVSRIAEVASLDVWGSVGTRV